jgi:hypothetical protein
MTGDHQVERQAGDFEVGQRRIDVVAGGDQRADQIVGRLALAPPDGIEKIML